ncbi:NlpC/P60 family protein [Paraclostridium dentum]|uniref:NlpC/P60 family protein n=1 Tax=Paraclostridium dentum TaxID=2662455 RepID=UPI0014740B5C|nr:NlpC/P60 family protein [Paraclostridium dentum]
MKRKISKLLAVFTLLISIVLTSGIQAHAATRGEDIVAEAKRHLGKPYVWGATGPNSFDCSGLTQYVYKQFGIDITRTTSTQINAGTSVSKSDLQLGDLVFTSSTHVGIYVGNNQIIHAPQSGDVVKISKIWSYHASRRILSNSDKPTTPYHFENVAFYANSSQSSETVPIYRYYNGTDHFYTPNYNELGSGGNGYKFENVAFYAYPSQKTGTVPVYRYYNGTDHLYTSSYNELGNGSNGYKFEGIAFYAYPSQTDGTYPVYRCFNGTDHFYTTNSAEVPK